MFKRQRAYATQSPLPEHDVKYRESSFFPYGLVRSSHTMTALLSTVRCIWHTLPHWQNRSYAQGLVLHCRIYSPTLTCCRVDLIRRIFCECTNAWFATNVFSHCRAPILQAHFVEKAELGSTKSQKRKWRKSQSQSQSQSLSQSQSQSQRALKSPEVPQTMTDIL